MWSDDFPGGDLKLKINHFYYAWFTEEDLNWIGPELRILGYISGEPDKNKSRYKLLGRDLGKLIFDFGFTTRFEFEEVPDHY